MSAPSTYGPGSPSATAVTAPVPTPVADDDAAERGRLEIAWSVVRKIAEHAADLTEGTTSVTRRVAGVGLGRTRSSAKVEGYGDLVDVRLEVPLVYPAPIAVAVEAVRGNVRERVESLTGYRVRSLDVTVSALADPASAPPRSGRVE